MRYRHAVRGFVEVVDRLLEIALRIVTGMLVPEVGLEPTWTVKPAGFLSSMGEGDRRVQDYTTDHILTHFLTVRIVREWPVVPLSDLQFDHSVPWWIPGRSEVWDGSQPAMATLISSQWYNLANETKRQAR